MQEKDYMQIVRDNLETVTSQDILDSYGITEYTADDIVHDFTDAMAFKEEQARVFKILDAADHSDIWKVFNRKMPSYVQTPVANMITIIKEATKASIMPTAFAGEFRPLSMNAKQIAKIADKYFHMKWNAADMDTINSEAADYAYLHGTSGVLFGWQENIVDPSDVTKLFNPKRLSKLQAKAYHPSNIFPDPSGTDVDEMRYLFFAERKSKSFLRSIPRFQNAMYAIENANDSVGSPNPNYILDKNKQSMNEVVTFLTCYKKVMRMQVDEVTGLQSMRPSVDIVYMAGRNILDVSKDIRPSCIPFVPLYDEKIPNNFWGISKCYKVLSLVLTLNQLDSTEATAYFKNQNPAEFINSLSGLNVAEYQRKRGNPEAAFTVNCDPKLVHAYAERPDLPKNLDTFRQYLIQTIQEVSGVDSAYLGRSYGSIQTTGGVSQAIDRATMRDNTRIKAIDNFIRKELEIITQFYIMNGAQESFYPQTSEMQNPEQNEEMLFDPVQLATRQDIVLEVTNCAPRSNASYEEAAQKIFEIQMKYAPSEKGYPDLITPEEFVSWLNIPKPQKTVLLERMNNQMQNMKLEEYMAVLTAVGTLVEGGMPDEQAVQEVVKMIVNSPMGQIPATNPNPGQPMPR
jgi:hypothetical protein